MASIRKSQSDRSAETSGKILRAAQKLFALRGFDGVTMRAIASEAGVNLASIVYYFENKEGLYLAVFRQYADGGAHENAERSGPSSVPQGVCPCLH